MGYEGDSKLIDKLHASHSDQWVVIRWEHRGDPPAEVIVVKSETGPARSLEELFAERPDQRAIYFDTGTQCQDQDVISDVRYHYTVFAQAPDGSWHRQGVEHVSVPFYRTEVRQAKLHDDGTMMAKLDTLRQGLFRGPAGPF